MPRRLHDWFEDRCRTAPLRVAAGAVLVAWAAYFVVFVPYFDTYDDGFMSLLTAGKAVSPEADVHMISTHILVGRVLTQLTGMLPQVPWYGLYLLSLHFAAHVALLYLAIRATPRAATLLPSLILFSSLGVLLLNRLQFTSTAILVGLTGYVLGLQPFLTAAEEAGPSSRRWGQWSAGVLFVVVAGLVRGQCFLLASGLMLPVIGCVALFGRNWRLLGAATAFAAVAGGVTVGAMRYDEFAYERDPDWQGFVEFRTLAVKLLDYHVAERGLEDTTLERLGWTSADLELLGSNFWADGDKLAVPKLSQLVAASEPPLLAGAARIVAGTVVAAWGTLQTPPLALCVVGAFAGAFWTSRSRRQLALAVTACAIVLLAEGALLGVLDRLPPRVQFPMTALPAIFCLCFLPTAAGSRETPCPRRWRTVLAVVLLVLTAIVLVGQVRANRSQAEQNARFRGELTRLQPQPDQLFVTWQYTAPTIGVRPLTNDPVYDQLHFYDFGLASRTPIGERMLRAHRLDDVHTAILTRDDVFLCCQPQNLRLYARYIRERFGHAIAPELIFRSDVLPVYRIRPRDESAPGAS